MSNNKTENLALDVVGLLADPEVGSLALAAELATELAAELAAELGSTPTSHFFLPYFRFVSDDTTTPVTGDLYRSVEEAIAALPFLVAKLGGLEDDSVVSLGKEHNAEGKERKFPLVVDGEEEGEAGVLVALLADTASELA